MPINSFHPEYDADKSKLTKDANAGDVLNYIPRLAGQTKTEYDQYRNRAAYYNVTKRTNIALTGAVLRKPYTTNIDVNDITIYGGLNFDEFLSESISDVMVTGRIGMLVDYNETTQTPYIVSYENATIVNWQSVDDKMTLIILREDTFRPKANDPYSYENVVQYRELFLDEDGYYSVRLWEEDGRSSFKVVNSYQPNIRGVRFDEIPFIFVNTCKTNPEVTEPVLYNIAQINLSHFKTSADIEHSAHFTALPQPYIAGDLKEDTTELPIGTYTVWQLAEDAKVGYLEFSGSGISALQDISKRKEEQMASLGASLLQSPKGVESAEALRIRQGSESSSLITIATGIESAMQQVLTIYYTWLGQETEVEFELSRDFTAVKLSPQALKALMDAYLAGTISQDTFLENLYEGEVVNDVEEEKTKTSLTTDPV